jgi:hypothetical protein
MSDHEHDQPGREQGYSDPTQPVTGTRPVDQGEPGREQGYSDETQPAPAEPVDRVSTTPADLPNLSQDAGADAAAAGYDAEPSAQYDPVAAWRGDGEPDAAPSGADGNALEQEAI